LNFLAGIISTPHGPGTGAFVVLEHLIKAWPAHADPLLVIAPRNSPLARLCVEHAVECVDLPTRRDRLVENVPRMPTTAPLLRKCRVVHAWHSRGFELAWLAGRRLGVPTAATMHDHPDCRTHGILRRRLIRLSAARLDRIACVSNAVREAWRSVREEKRLVVIHNGLVDQAPARAPTGGGPVRVGFLGMYAAWKGFDVVARWIRETPAEHTQWRLYGEPEAALRPAAAALAAQRSASVRLCGTCRPDTIFSEIDVLVHASLEFDPFPTVLIEAARAGIPVVASARGGAGEIVIHADTGFLFRPDDPATGLAHLRRLLADASLRAAMGAAARKRFVRHFTVQRMVEDYRSFWSELGGAP